MNYFLDTKPLSTRGYNFLGNPRRVYNNINQDQSDNDFNYFMFRYSFATIMDDLAIRVRSYVDMTEIQKLNSVILHQIVESYHANGKKVYLWGSSFGAVTLYNYLTRYGNDSDGLYAAGGPVNDYLYPIAPGFSIIEGNPFINRKHISIEFLKNNYSKENIYDAMTWDRIYDWYVSNSLLDEKIHGRIEKKDAKYMQFVNFVAANCETLMKIADNLTNTEVISKMKLNKNKTILAIGSNDDRFYYTVSSYYSRIDFYNLQNWSLNNFKKSGLTFLSLEGATHTANWGDISVSPYIIANMMMDNPPLMIETEADLQAIIDKWDF